MITHQNVNGTIYAYAFDCGMLDKDNVMNNKDPNEHISDHYVATVKENEAGELYIDLPQKMMDQLGWEIGDEVEWGETEICEEWGEHKGFTLSNLTKNPKVESRE